MEVNSQTRRPIGAARLVAAVVVSVTLGAGLLWGGVMAISAQPPASRAIVAFTKAESDQIVESFIQRHGLRVEAVYLWSTGLTGTYRTYEPRSAHDLLAHARQESITLFSKALTANLRKVDSFTATNSEAATVASTALTTEGRSVLNNNVQVKVAIASARAQGPLVYAIEAIGLSPEQFEALSGDALVSAVATKEGAKTAGVMKPTAYQAEWRDAAVAALDPSQVNSQLRGLKTASPAGAGR